MLNDQQKENLSKQKMLQDHEELYERFNQKTSERTNKISLHDAIYGPQDAVQQVMTPGRGAHKKQGLQTIQERQEMTNKSNQVNEMTNKSNQVNEMSFGTPKSFANSKIASALNLIQPRSQVMQKTTQAQAQAQAQAPKKTEFQEMMSHLLQSMQPYKLSRNDQKTIGTSNNLSSTGNLFKTAKLSRPVSQSREHKQQLYANNTLTEDEIDAKILQKVGVLPKNQRHKLLNYKAKTEWLNDQNQNYPNVSSSNAAATASEPMISDRYHHSRNKNNGIRLRLRSQVAKGATAAVVSDFSFSVKGQNLMKQNFRKAGSHTNLLATAATTKRPAFKHTISQPISTQIQLFDDYSAFTTSTAVQQPSAIKYDQLQSYQKSQLLSPQNERKSSIATTTPLSSSNNVRSRHQNLVDRLSKKTTHHRHLSKNYKQQQQKQQIDEIPLPNLLFDSKVLENNQHQHHKHLSSR